MAKRSVKKPEQSMMAALRAEHRHIANVVALFGDQLTAIEEGQLVDTHVVYETIDYMVRWPDRFHHPREDILYARAAELDAELADSVDSLQREHDDTARRGRELLASIERWRDGAVSGTKVVESGREYIRNTHRHMNSEEKLVFPQIEALLDESDWVELGAQDRLKPYADPVFGSRVHRDFRNLARKLRLGVKHGVERGVMTEWVSLDALIESYEVFSIAYDSTASVTRDHLKAAWFDSVDIVRDKPFTALFHCGLNNTRLSVRWLGEMVEISKDALEDLSRVNQERKDQIRVLRREGY